jgi:pSer/pThr/pTyr-binding forkhead associated (FHA) protein
MAIFWVQVRQPGHSARVVPVRGRIEAGRDSDELLLDSPTISRRHLWLEPTTDGLMCADMNSANGTFVNDVRIDGPVLVRAGDVIRVGETELVVHQGHETVGSTESARPPGSSGPPGASGSAGEAHERPSEARRELNVAASKGPAGRGPRPAPSQHA